MEMYQIRYFLSVARELNFTRAAEECGVAQPSLSRAIKQLEGELGGELFRRERPQAILTELGHRMLPILTRCFESAAAAQALAAGTGKGGAGALRVALSPTIGVELVLPALREASRLFDGLELVVRRESAAGTLDLLKTGEVEVAICRRGRFGGAAVARALSSLRRGIPAYLGPRASTGEQRELRSRRPPRGANRAAAARGTWRRARRLGARQGTP